MARRGGAVSRSAPVPARAAPARPAPARPAPAAHPPAPAPQQQSVPAPMQPQSGGGGMLSGIGSTIVQGMAFGTGSAIAHRAVGAVAGSFSGNGSNEPNQQAAAPSAPEYAQGAMMTPQQQLQDTCAMDKQMFYECLGQNKGDQTSCNFLYDQLKQCQQSQTQMQFR